MPLIKRTTKIRERFVQALRSARNWRAARSKLATITAFSSEVDRSFRPRGANENGAMMSGAAAARWKRARSKLATVHAFKHTPSAGQKSGSQLGTGGT